ncbi:poly-beta-1,6-N-acetyl-D-glucosamine biosynthesis protein PgaD [Oceanisphaera litoralis]|uniref:hypothetical protein n=1 Tax=Oceanisphaera litoralis TaxID=225144 RepID=UPI0019599ECF|nr:hypothetical protein [Oceanisphaera litoralis]MBM7455474.1 poly-beta-1,6-N-acetyl-D-glucosamine biosynthesis protein PgaD [Oceanisphaera litoralis]
MTKSKQGVGLIIDNGSRRNFLYRIRDLIVLMLIWSGWILVLLLPFLHSYEIFGIDDKFTDNYDVLGFFTMKELVIITVLLIFSNFILFHFWAKYKRFIFSWKSRASAHRKYKET